MTSPVLSPGRLAGATVAVWARHLPAFVVLAALAWGTFVGAMVATFAIHDLTRRPAAGAELAAAWTFAIAVPVVSTLHAGAVAAAALRALRERRIRLLGGFPAAWAVLRRAPSIVATGVLSAGAVFAGAAALVVPGLFLAAALAPILPIALGERAGPVRAFARSFELTRGHRAAVALGQLLVGAIAAALALAVRAGAEAIPSGLLPRGAGSDVVFWGLAPVLALTALTLPFVGGAVAYRALVAAKEPPPAAALEAVFE